MFIKCNTFYTNNWSYCAPKHLLRLGVILMYSTKVQKKFMQNYLRFVFCWTILSMFRCDAQLPENVVCPSSDGEEKFALVKVPKNSMVFQRHDVIFFRRHSDICWTYGKIAFSPTVSLFEATPMKIQHERNVGHMKLMVGIDRILMSVSTYKTYTYAGW